MESGIWKEFAQIQLIYSYLLFNLLNKDKERRRH